MTLISHFFRYKDGVAPNVGALSATLLGYPAGIALLTHPSWMVKGLGFFMVTMTLIWSAYFIHEFAHQSIFKTAPANGRWGTLMSWINGSCYARFDDLRRKHMRHHVERADVITFDVQAFLRARPAWFRNAVLALEWAYFPAVEFIMRGFVISLPFTDPGNAKSSRARIVAIFLARISAFAALGWYSPSALILYFAAYLAFVTTLRFADCFQHTYDAFQAIGDAPSEDGKVRDKAYEQENTYSNVFGLNNPLLNLLWLNFGYHNAHHERPTMPWYRLPAFHKELYGDGSHQVIPVRQLFKSFHANRVRRILAADYGKVLPPNERGRADGFVGAVGVSFLTDV